MVCVTGLRMKKARVMKPGFFWAVTANVFLTVPNVSGS